jgi:hypothetical protein
MTARKDRSDERPHDARYVALAVVMMVAFLIAAIALEIISGR